MAKASEAATRWLIEFFYEQEGQPIETKPAFFQVAQAVLGAMIFGLEPVANHPFMERLQELETEFESVLAKASSLSKYFPTLELLYKQQHAKEKEALAKILNHVRSRIQEYKAERKVDREIYNVMDAIFATIKEIPQDEIIARNVTDEKIVGMAFDLFEAPAASLSEAMMWVFLTLHRFPDVQERAREEISHYCGTNYPTLAEHHPKLLYTRAILYEVWRWNTIWVFEGMQRATTDDVWFRGYFLEKGTIYWPNMYSIHHDPKIFAQPELFKPERFLKPDGILDETLIMKVQSFGMGTRRCIGESFSMQLLVLMLATVLQRFSVFPDPYQRGDPLREVTEVGFDYSPAPHKVMFKPLPGFDID